MKILNSHVNRPTKVEVFLLTAQQQARLSTCPRRKVGVVIVDKYDKIIATGFNGKPEKFPHDCHMAGCKIDNHEPGKNLSDCMAIHAEINAIAHLKNVKKARALFLWGAAPCTECAKVICNTKVEVVYTNQLYTPEQTEAVRGIFSKKNIKMILVNFSDSVSQRVNDGPEEIVLETIIDNVEEQRKR